MSFCDEKLLKLNERMDQPLPSYTRQQINRTRKILLESNMKEKSEILKENGSKMKKNRKMSKKSVIQKLEKEPKTTSKKEKLKNLVSRGILDSANVVSKNLEVENSKKKVKVKEEKKKDGLSPKKISSESSFAKKDLFNCFFNREQSEKYTTNFFLGKKIKNSISSDSNPLINFKPQNNKITDYFNFNQNQENQKNSPKLFTSFDQLNLENYYNNNDGGKKEKKLMKYKILIKEKDKEIISLHKIIQRNELENKDFKGKAKDIIKDLLVEFSEIKRQEDNNFIRDEKRRIGRYLNYREGHKYNEMWEDGYELTNLKKDLKKVVKQRDFIEKERKKLKKTKRSQSTDSNDLFLNDLKENKETLKFQYHFFQREENLLKEKINLLENQKYKYLTLQKKINEEKHSRFGGITNPKRFPVLNERYQLLALLGKGGFSEVYKAYDLEQLKFVACKIHQINKNWKVNTRSNYIKHALRENQVLKALDHKNIVNHYDSVEIDSDSFCTVLEYCNGSDLRSYIKKLTTVPEKDAKSIIKQILLGLKFLNKTNKKIIHYDLKPQNILFSNGVVKISDFGLCKIMEENDTKLELTSQGVGTYWYLPPECFKYEAARISTKVDVWSLGVIYYEMVYGVRPFCHNMSQERILKEGLMLKVMNLEFPSKPNISDFTKDFIRKCLEYHQENRLDVFEAFDLLDK